MTSFRAFLPFFRCCVWCRMSLLRPGVVKQHRNLPSFLPSYLHPFLPSYLHPFLPSYFIPSIPPSSFPHPLLYFFLSFPPSVQPSCLALFFFFLLFSLLFQFFQVILPNPCYMNNSIILGREHPWCCNLPLRQCHLLCQPRLLCDIAVRNVGQQS